MTKAPTMTGGYDPQAVSPSAQAPITKRVTSRSKITSSGCWLWLGRVIDGQPVAKLSGRRRCLRPAVYRESIGMANLNDAGGQRVRMTCGNSLCLNPQHMAVPAIQTPKLTPTLQSTDDGRSKPEREALPRPRPKGASIPDAELVGRLLNQGRWDELSASHWVWRNLIAELQHATSPLDQNLSDDLNSEFQRLVAAVLACQTVQGIANALENSPWSPVSRSSG